MFRFFSTKPRIPSKLQYDGNGERLILQWSGVSKFFKIFSLSSASYIYLLSTLDPSTLLGSISQYTVPILSCTTFLLFTRFRKFLHKLILLEGGKVLKIETYPMAGWGHYTKRLVHISQVEGIVPYGMYRWYNPLRIGRGFYKLKYEGTLLGFKKKNFVIFKIPEEYDKEVLKLVAVGKEVSESNLRMLSKYQL